MIWTISAALGTGGPAVAAELAERAGVHRSSTAVVLAPGAFAALRDHPSAVHVRLHAPLPWRVDAFARCELVDHACAEKKVKHDDHAKRAWVRTLFHLDLDDTSLFSVALDVSRFTTEQLSGVLLAARNG